MSTTTEINRLSVRPSEHSLHPQFYQILNIPPSPLSKAEAAYHLYNYLERTGALVITEDNHEQYILINKDVSLLSGLDTFTTREADQERRKFGDFARVVWRHVRLSK